MGRAIYVLHGVYFFLTNPSLWRATVCPLMTTIAFSIFATVMFFVLVFKPQADLFAGYVALWLAYFMSFFLTLLEIVLCIWVFAALVLQYYRTRLENRVYELKDVQLEDKSSCTGDVKIGVQMAGLSFLIFFVTLPLNALPILGSVMFMCLNGMTFAWGLHASYFSMKGLSFHQQLAFVRSNWKEYMAFGTSAIGLSMIPLLNLLLVWTNIVGAALWVVDLEKNSALEGYHTPGAENTIKPEEIVVEGIPMATETTVGTGKPQRLFSNDEIGRAHV